MLFRSELKEYGITPSVCDPVADAGDAKRFYGVDLVPIEEMKDLDCLIIAVAHKEFKALTNDDISKMFKNGKGIIVDVKGVLNKDEMISLGYKYWRL